MRILVAGFQHETNTFAQRPADWPAFLSGEFFPAFTSGPDFLAAGRHVGLPIGGFVQAAQAAGNVVIQSCWAGASPSAPVTAHAFDIIRQQILTDIGDAQRVGPLDAVYLDLHGAAVTDNCDAPEVALLSAVRDATGPDTPLVVSLDSHANVDARLLSLADYATCYRTYPHVDMVDTGRRAYALLSRRRTEGTRPLVSLQRIPFLIPILSQSTLFEPARRLYGLLERLETELDCDASFATGFPAADVPHCGPTVWAYGAQGAAAVRQLCDAIVSARPDWRVTVQTCDEAVRAALELAKNTQRPVVIADPQDNPGAGASGRTTGLLRALHAADAGLRWPGRVAVGLINDPAAARLAAAAGVGAVVELDVGASVRSYSGELTPPPVRGRFTVRSLRQEAVALTGPMMNGTRIELGQAACLEIDGIMVCISSGSTQVLDRSLFQALGVEPADMAVVALKSAVHFRADFQSLASHILMARSPGEMAADPADLPWQRLRLSVTPDC